MKKHGFLAFTAVLLLSAALLSSCMTMIPVRTLPATSYENPQWAPPYYDGARYYYIPDLELYYDLSSRDYIYLMDGRWQFSPYLPSIYRDYDLNNCFCVVLNIEVYRPWLHHQYYLSHYPRYYYRDYYDHSGIAYVRAYNENLRRAIYWKENERNRARAWDNSNVRDNRRFRYSRDDRREQQTQTREGSSTFGGGQRDQRNEQADRSSARPSTENNRKQPVTERSTRTETKERKEKAKQEAEATRNNRTNYYGRTIGNSVPVTKQMRDNTRTPAARPQAPSGRTTRTSAPTGRNQQ